MFSFSANVSQSAHARLQIALRNVFQQFMPEVVRGVENFREDGLRAPLEVHDLAASIVWGLASFDPAVFLQPI